MQYAIEISLIPVRRGLSNYPSDQDNAKNQLLFKKFVWIKDIIWQMNSDDVIEFPDLTISDVLPEWMTTEQNWDLDSKRFWTSNSQSTELARNLSDRRMKILNKVVMHDMAILRCEILPK